MNRIIELNQNGIATMNGGTITVENVPDTVLKGGKNEFDAWSQGALDGKDAQTLANGGTPKSGRTPSEIQASMEANKDKSSYATAFIDGVGPENITKLPITFASEQQKEESGFNTQLASTLGNILAAATSSWSSEKNKEVSDKILQTVDCENSEKDPTTYRAEQINEAKQLVALNYILGSHDNDGNYVNDLRFGTDFLVRMAEGLEKIDPGKIETLRLNAKFSNEDKAFYAMYEKGLSFNPMSGVLDAMGGNADAALKYLAPSGKNGQVDTSRVDKLTKYDWSWDPTGFGGAHFSYRRSIQQTIINCNQPVWRSLRKRKSSPTSRCCRSRNCSKCTPSQSTRLGVGSRKISEGNHQLRQCGKGSHRTVTGELCT